MKHQGELHWEQDSVTGLFLLKQTKKRPTKTATSFSSKAGTFVDVRNRIMEHPAVWESIRKQLIEALGSWAVMKMGRKRSQYVQEAYRDFVTVCSFIVTETNRDIGQVANEVSFEFPLQISKKRTAFTALIPELYLIAAEYEKVCDTVTATKKGVKTLGQFKLVLRESLQRFALEENLKPVPQKALDKLLQHYHLRTLPSQIALDYVGLMRGTSGANIKKLLVIARDPNRVDKSLRKYLTKARLPKDFDAILRTLGA